MSDDPADHLRQDDPDPYSATPRTPPRHRSRGDGTNGFAITSLVLGIIGLVGFCMPYLSIFISIGAVVFGHIASGQIARAHGAQEGAGMAKAGLITGYIGLLLNALMLAFVIIAIVYGELPIEGYEGY